MAVITFFIGLMIGGCFGCIVTALCVAAGRDDEKTLGRQVENVEKL